MKKHQWPDSHAAREPYAPHTPVLCSAQEAWNLYLGWESDDVGVPFHGRNLWPDAALVPGFRPAMTAYYHAMNGVAERRVRPRA